MVLCICFDVSDSFFACREACFPARSRHLLIFVKRLAIQGYGIYLQMRGLYRKASCRKIGVHAMFLATSAILHCKYKFCAFFQALSLAEMCPQIPNNPGITFQVTSKAGNSGPLEASRSASIMIPRIPDNSDEICTNPESIPLCMISFLRRIFCWKRPETSSGFKNEKKKFTKNGLKKVRSIQNILTRFLNPLLGASG